MYRNRIATMLSQNCAHILNKKSLEIIFTEKYLAILLINCGVLLEMDLFRANINKKALIKIEPNDLCFLKLSFLARFNLINQCSLQTHLNWLLLWFQLPFMHLAPKGLICTALVAGMVKMYTAYTRTCQGVLNHARYFLRTTGMWAFWYARDFVLLIWGSSQETRYPKTFLMIPHCTLNWKRQRMLTCCSN